MLMAQTLNGYYSPRRQPEMYVYYYIGMKMCAITLRLIYIIIIIIIIIIQLSIDQAFRIGIKLTEAVHYMHTHDPIIIHQDIKLHNVLVCTA